MEEKLVWKGSPSHLVNFGVYLLNLLVLAIFVVVWVQVGQKIKSAGSVLFWLAIAVTILPLCMIFYKWLRLKSQVYELTSERLKMTTGIMNKKTNLLELYRAKDYLVTEPFFMRLFSLGNIEILTSDPTSPRLLLRAIRKPRSLLDQLRVQVEECRERKGVRQLDIDQVDSLQPK